MIGYPYIQSLFKAVLTASKVVQGRFHVCPSWGSEINKINIGEIVSIAMPKEPKYPCAIMMPPTKTGNFQFSAADTNSYSYYSIQLLFLRPSAYTTYNQVSQPLGTTNQTTHTTVDTWHDMDRCSENFLRVLHDLLQENTINQVVISESKPGTILPVTSIGNDEVSGVAIYFTLGVNPNCEIEDYAADYLTSITLPAISDTHPSHTNS